MASPINGPTSGCLSRCGSEISKCFSRVGNRLSNLFSSSQGRYDASNLPEGQEQLLAAGEVTFASDSSNLSPVNPEAHVATEITHIERPLNYFRATPPEAAFPAISETSGSAASTSSIANLRLPENYSEEIREIIGDRTSTLARPSAGGGGGPSLIAENKYFLKFQFNMQEYFGNLMLRQLGEVVPQCAIVSLENNEIGSIFDYFAQDADFIRQIEQLRENDTAPLIVMIMPIIHGIDFHNLKKMRDLSLENIQYLATELGRIAVKDYVTQIGDRILGKTNPGNLMLPITQESRIDKKQRLILIDNVFNFFFQKKTMTQKSKQQTLYFIIEQVTKFLNECSLDIDTSNLRDNILKGIKQGIKDLKTFINNMDKMPKIEQNLQATQNQVVANINAFLKKMA